MLRRAWLAPLRMVQSAIAELVLELEKTNPTPAPARSAKLDGTWAVKFPAFFGPGIIDSPTRELALMLYAGGLKPGLLLQVIDKLPPFAAGACSVDRLTVTFEGGASGAPSAEGTLAGAVFNNPFSFTLRSALSSESDSRLRETYVEASIFDRTVRRLRAHAPGATRARGRLAPTRPCRSHPSHAGGDARRAAAEPFAHAHLP